MEPDAIRRWFTERGLICSTIPAITDALTFEPKIRLFGKVSLGGSSIGAYSYVSPNTTMHRTTIGRYASIGDRCTLGPSQHPSDWLTSSPISYKNVFETEGTAASEVHDELKPVRIGHDVWIGASTAVMGGVTIGDGAIVAFGSVVTKDVAPYTIVGGVPARLIRMRFPLETIAALQGAAWWRLDLPRMRGAAIRWRDPLLALEDLASKETAGDVAPIAPTLHRIERKGPNEFGFTKLR